jgi:hypothetical protein
MAADLHEWPEATSVATDGELGDALDRALPLIAPEC